MNLKKIFKKKKSSQNILCEMNRVLSLTHHYQNSALHKTASGVGNTKEHEVILTLTTFGSRINDVHLTIESLLQQSLKADRICLWISEENFTENDIPELLRLQEKRGLEILFCPQDLGPYTKFYYTLKNNPNSLLITVDDDILYPSDLVDLLYRAYVKNPNVIHCHRAHRISFDTSDKLLPYKKWEWSVTDSEPSHSIFPTGVGGVLYFPGCFAQEVLDKETFLKLAPNADDVWLKAMALKNNIAARRVEDIREWGKRFPQIEGSQVVALKRRNKSAASGNDQKLDAVFTHFGLLPLLNK